MTCAGKSTFRPLGLGLGLGLRFEANLTWSLIPDLESQDSARLTPLQFGLFDRVSPLKRCKVGPSNSEVGPWIWMLKLDARIWMLNLDVGNLYSRTKGRQH